MNNTQLSVYIGKSPKETRILFDSIREAFEEAGLGEITKQVADLYLYGTSPSNYAYYLDRLEARKFLSEQGGYRMITTEQILKTGFFDPWVMLVSAANYYIGEEIPKEFETLILNPTDAYLKIGEDEQVKKKRAITKARKTIAAMNEPLTKVIKELAEVEPWLMAGTEEESIKIEFNNIIERIEKIV